MIDLKGQKTAVALGTFDGLHRGHMSVIKSAVIQKNNGLLPVIMLFSQHPVKVLTGKTPKELFSGSIKKRETEKTGCVPAVVSFEKIRNMSAEDFFCEVLLNDLNAGFISCGFNFKFAKNGAGDITKLAVLCEKYHVGLSVADEVDYDSLPISSTRIRNAVAAGDMENANAMLGRYFSYDFPVVHGDNRGGKILGFPTINQFFPDNFAVPKYGVYASFAVVGEKTYPAVTNIGIRPTIGNSLPRSETFIYGFSGDLYESNTEVGLLSYLRGEQKFSSLEALAAQMQKDCEKSVAIFRKEENKWGSF